MSNITKNHKVGIFAIFIASALMLGTISVSGFDTALATKYKDKNKHDSKDRDKHDSKDRNNRGGNSNSAKQSIDQSQFSDQDSVCVSSGTGNPGQGQGGAGVIAFSCNNDSDQANLNFGDNTVGQQ